MNFNLNSNKKTGWNNGKTLSLLRINRTPPKKQAEKKKPFHLTSSQAQAQHGDDAKEKHQIAVAHAKATIMYLEDHYESKGTGMSAW